MYAQNVSDEVGYLSVSRNLCDTLRRFQRKPRHSELNPELVSESLPTLNIKYIIRPDLITTVHPRPTLVAYTGREFNVKIKIL